jgi:uncharacterized protein
MSSSRAESTYSEIVVVLALAFGNSVFISLMVLFGALSLNPVILTPERVMGIVVGEILMAVCIVWFLRSKGWILADFNLGITWKSTGTGALLAIASMGASYVLRHALNFFAINIDTEVLRYAASDWSLYSALILCLINPIYEEAVVVGYLMTVFADPKNPAKALNISVGVRLLYHLYQGPAALITIFPMGLLFSFYYLRRGKLWPLIFAHALMDVSWFAIKHYYAGV